MDELEIYQDVYKIAKPVIDPLVSTFLSPKLERLKKWLKKNETKRDIDNHFWESKFGEYLLRTFQNTYYINTIVFPNQQIKLLGIFHPVTIFDTKDHNRAVSNEIDVAFLNANKRILISDHAGMGKSTLSRFLAYHAIQQKLGVPIFIELRKLNQENTILKELYNQLNPIDDNFNLDFILQILKRGDFVIILDGFDEIPIANQELVIADVRYFISRVPKNNFVLTSRPEAALASFGDFQEFHIRPLHTKEAFEIIKKLDKLSGTKIGDRLIADINERLDSINEFLSNPFLVSLLYKSYSYNKDIPSKKSTFYEEVYSALYKAHDLSKDGYKRGKRCKLDIQDFRVVLRELAFDSAKLRVVEYSEQELIANINKAKEKCTDLDFKANDFFEDLKLSVPLIIKDGNKYKWAHKSIQDFFAAEFICFHAQKEAICNKIYETENEAFLNVLVLLQELDPKLFRKTILLKLLKDFQEHYNNSYVDFPDNSDVKLRKVLTFGIVGYFIKDNQVNFSRINEYDNYLLDLLNEKYEKNAKLRFRVMGVYTVKSSLNYLYAESFQSILLNTTCNSCKKYIGYDEFYRVSYNFREDIILNPVEEFIKLDTSQENILNSSVNFRPVNGMLLRNKKDFSKREYEIPDIEKCNKLLSEIEQEIERDNTFDVLDGI